MNERDWFFVGVRLFGVWVLLDAVTEARYLIEIAFSLAQPVRTPVGVYVLHLAIDLLVGFYLLAGAPGIGRFVFSSRHDGVSCSSCGYNLTGNTGGRCPECGSPVPKTTSDTAPRD
jgi:hypothetical protein